MFRSSKPINLSSKQTLSKQELVQKSKAERELRLIIQQKEQSAMKIQQKWRQRKSKLFILKQLKSDLKAKTRTDSLSLALLVGLDDIINYDFLDEWQEKKERLSFLIIRLLKKRFSLELLGKCINLQLSSDRSSQRILEFILSFEMKNLANSINDVNLDMISGLVLNCFRLRCTISDIELKEFIHNFMSIPMFFENISIQLLNRFLSDFPVYSLLKCMKSLNLDHLPNMEILCIFSNLIFFNHKIANTFDSNSFSLYIEVCNVFITFFPTLVDNDSNDSDEEINEDDLDNRYFVNIENLKRSDFIANVIKLDDIQLCCTFIVGIMTRFPKSRLEIASSILYRHDCRFLDNITDYYVNSSLSFCISSYSEDIFTRKDLMQEWYVLVTICELYSRYLLTITDEELLSLLEMNQNLVKLTVNLKLVTFDLFWSNRLILSPMLISLSSIQSLFSKFLSQIYDRDNRISFTPPDHWLITSLDLKQSFDQFQKKQREASFLEEKDLRVIQILRHIPFVIPFADRVKLFRQYVFKIKEAPLKKVTIRRNHIFEDGFDQLNSLGSLLKNNIAIIFIDEYGIEEAGIDGGGVFKEFLSECLLQAFSPNAGLFTPTLEQLLYPSPSDYASEPDQLKLIEFLGRIIGKALYEKILINISFAPFFLSKWLGKNSFLDDLVFLDKELYRNLNFLKNYEGDVEELALTFSIDTDAMGTVKVKDLIYNGRSIAVTNENKMKYVYAVSNYKLNIQIRKGCQKFLEGLSDLINLEWLLMFSEPELQLLISGEQKSIDVEDMKRFVAYDGVYDSEHPTIKFFWLVVEEFTGEQKEMLLKFITSSSRAPLLGFQEMNPPICIRFGGQDQSRLPSASTCVNLLKLPAYGSKALLSQ